MARKRNPNAFKDLLSRVSSHAKPFFETNTEVRQRCDVRRLRSVIVEDRRGISCRCWLIWTSALLQYSIFDNHWKPHVSLTQKWVLKERFSVHPYPILAKSWDTLSSSSRENPRRIHVWSLPWGGCHRHASLRVIWSHITNHTIRKKMLSYVITIRILTANYKNKLLCESFPIDKVRERIMSISKWALMVNNFTVKFVMGFIPAIPKTQDHKKILSYQFPWRCSAALLNSVRLTSTCFNGSSRATTTKSSDTRYTASRLQLYLRL